MWTKHCRSERAQDAQEAVALNQEKAIPGLYTLSFKQQIVSFFRQCIPCQDLNSALLDQESPPTRSLDMGPIP